MMWLVVHLFYIVGFKSRVTTVLHWLVSFLGRGRSQRVATQQQVFGGLALENLGPEFEASKTGGPKEAPSAHEAVPGRRSACPGDSATGSPDGDQRQRGGARPGEGAHGVGPRRHEVAPL